MKKYEHDGSDHEFTHATFRGQVERVDTDLGPSYKFLLDPTEFEEQQVVEEEGEDKGEEEEVEEVEEAGEEEAPAEEEKKEETPAAEKASRSSRGEEGGLTCPCSKGDSKVTYTSVKKKN